MTSVKEKHQIFEDSRQEDENKEEHAHTSLYNIHSTYIKAVNTEHDTSAHILIIAVKTSNPEPLRARTSCML